VLDFPPCERAVCAVVLILMAEGQTTAWDTVNVVCIEFEGAAEAKQAVGVRAWGSHAARLSQVELTF
jgi:xanthine dehydrogenase iron-sulfur cluster and FAD-binding subunit A